MTPDERYRAVHALVEEAFVTMGVPRLIAINDAIAVLHAWHTDEQVALGFDRHIPHVFKRGTTLTEEQAKMRRPTPPPLCPRCANRYRKRPKKPAP